MRDHRSLEEAYVDAWMTIFPDGPRPEVVVKKWPHGARRIITTGCEKVHLTSQEFLDRLRAVEEAAKVIDRQRPKAIAAHG